MAGAGGSGKLETAAGACLRELAESAAVRRSFQWIASRRRWIDERHLELCRIPAPTFEEQERAEWMLARFVELGWKAELDKAGNVVAALSFKPRQYIAVTAHLDTVLAPRSADEITVDGDGAFRGPGVADNGAGLAALLALAGAVGELDGSDWDCPLLLVANVGEEGEGNLSGMRHLCRPSGLGARIGAFLILDGPSTDRITCRAVASRRFEILIQGPGGHSWSDSGAANPVHALSRAIALFLDRQGNGARREPATSDERTAFNFGVIEGGTSVNSIPALARAKVDLRSESPGRVEEMASLLGACLEKALEAENHRSGGARLSARIREIGYRPAGRLPLDAPLLGCLRAVDAWLGIRSQLDSASTDANIPLSLGMQAVSIGAGGEGGGAHTPAEWYHPRGREIGLKRILLAAALLWKIEGTALAVGGS
jgi:acetylornithine deacetylase/succinyl-diaminopimelate desuccinylase-like protein